MERLGHAVREGVKLSWKIHSPTDPSVSKLPLILIHGFACGIGDWGPFHRILAQKANRPVIAFDHRGIGDSDCPDGPYSITDLTKDTFAVLDSIDVHRAHVMGISMGGMVAQQCGHDEPDRCQSLILGCTTHGGREATPPPMEFLKACQTWQDEDPEAQHSFAKTFVDFGFPENWRETRGDSEAHFLKAIEQFKKTQRSHAGLAGQFAALTRFSSLKYVEGLAMPCLVVHGDHDQVVPFPNGKSLSEKLPNASFVPWKGAGHFFWEVRSLEMLDVLANFVDENDDAQQ